MMKKWFLIIIVLSAILFLQNCSSDNKPIESISVIPAVSSGDEILATVNNENITRRDLNFSIKHGLNINQVSAVSDTAKKTILKSLIVSRLMANAAKASLNGEGKSKLAHQVKAYEEQLLAQQYLKNSAVAQPVTQQMVETYYTQNPEKFGGGNIRIYEMMTSTTKPIFELRDALISSLDEMKENTDWEKSVTKPSLKRYSLIYSKTDVDEKLLHPQLQALIKPMKVNQTSPVSFIDGKPYLIRILSDKTKTPLPLSIVSAKIRKMLAPIQLRKSLEVISDKLMLQANIQYFDFK